MLCYSPADSLGCPRWDTSPAVVNLAAKGWWSAMWYRSLGFKLICSVGAIAVLVIGVYASVSIETQRGQLIQEVIRSTNLVSDTKMLSTI